MTDRLTPQREAEIKQGQPGEWLPGDWTIRDVERDGSTVWEVFHAGTLLATLPDWAGNVALWMADAHEAIPQLLAELAAVRAERNAFCDRVDTLTAVAKGNKRHVQDMFLELQKAQARVAELKKDSNLLARLEAAGVDNWDGYEDALEEDGS